MAQGMMLKFAARLSSVWKTATTRAVNDAQMTALAMAMRVSRCAVPTLFARGIANSSLKVATDTTIVEIESMYENAPKLPGEYNRVSIGAVKTMSNCAAAVPLTRASRPRSGP